jgi:hydrogenase nickel incorporation protein HypA/HybF
MHELGITQEILAIVTEQSRGARITRVVLEIGKLTAVFPDAVRFAFELCSEGTPAEGARLDILETPGRARCRACGAEMALDQPFGCCPCGGADLEWLAGNELKIKEMEVV